MKKYLWIGIDVSDATKKEILRRNGKLLSGFVSQKNILEGMDQSNIIVDSINSLQIDPRIMSYVKEESWSRTGKTVDVSVKYKNIRYISNIIREEELRKAAKKWALKNAGEDVVVFVYSIHTPFIAAAFEVKRIIPRCKIVILVLDLPQYMDLAMSPLKKVLKKLDWLRIKKLLQHIDGFALYAESMASYLNIPDNKWIVFEGSYDSDYESNHINCGEKVIMYSGLLDMNYGIVELIEAMKYLGNEYKLWLTGDGNAVDYIKEKASADSRIIYYGYFPSRHDLLDKQAEAMMLITPRKDTNEASKYCFPSKIFEYMASGNPVISCKLGGIPEEYFQYLIELPTVTPEVIAQTVRMVAEMKEELRKKIGAEGKSFIKSNKNKYVQARKLIEFSGRL